ncbi:ABC transporter ATP-binding protein [Gymnodinialimonas ceratoperidinii]|uniref:ABC transporter ATP-binding protein n=1 Tax=Gymnodinialimonas ceratoperidinii TaxID=2856823 RepID=A0A8F6TWA5_9RHOB|nr:ABC transporter ATP-binding protein [Gymnodinialimonas ceratoperidinii]QXT39855.1 ABC transporter ATP-binding protein [Gymnodinialimonas ceratoperidinii]
MTALIQIRDLKVHFPISTGLFSGSKGAIRAVDGVSLDIPKGQTLGLVGESGCGKSTLGRAVVGLTRPTGGEILIDGEPLVRDRRVQMIFQDPSASLNPRMTIGASIAEPVRLNKLRRGRAAIEARKYELLDLVGLPRSAAHRFPHEFSGGQRQRVGIARALACEPEIIVCDEAVSALDVSIQAQIVALLEDLQARLGLTYLFIAHDLGALKHISHQVAVMYLGRVVEIAAKKDIFTNPRHAYSRALLSAIPVPDPAVEKQRQRILLKGDIPSPANPPSGCRFHTRCPVAIDRCRSEDPAWTKIARNHESACWRASELSDLM